MFDTLQMDGTWKAVGHGDNTFRIQNASSTGYVWLSATTASATPPTNDKGSIRLKGLQTLSITNLKNFFPHIGEEDTGYLWVFSYGPVPVSVSSGFF